jgi:hypothetical protein
MKAKLIGIFALILVGCQATTSDAQVPRVYPGASWQTKTPAEAGMDSAKLNQLATHLGGNGLVIRHGYVVKSWNDPSHRVDWYSSMKPVLSTLLFFAIQEGMVSGVDAQIDPWWNGRLISKDKPMTFRHLGAMTSGYARGEAPGAAYAYNDFAIALYADTLFQKVFRQSAVATLTSPQRLGALGFQDGAVWGTVFGWARYHLELSSRDFARIVWLWLNKGSWNGTQLLNRSFFDQYLKPQVRTTTPRSSLDGSDYLDVGTIGGGPNDNPHGRGTYGFNWWFNATDAHVGGKLWPDAPDDTVMTSGAGGNSSVFIPSLDVVLVASGANWGANLHLYNTPLRMLVSTVTGAHSPPSPPPTPPAVTITGPTSLTNGSVGVAYSATFRATGATPISWSVETGSLPTGLTLTSSTGAYSGTPTAAGSYTFTVKATNADGNATKTYTHTINSASSPPPPPPPPPSGRQSVTSFTLINADTDLDIGPLNNGATINLATLPTRNLNVRANTSPTTVGSVRFAYDGNLNYQTENAAPYALKGDDSGNYNAWTPGVGSHTLKGTPYTSSGGTGTVGTALSISFNVTNLNVTNLAGPPSPLPPTPLSTPGIDNSPWRVGLSFDGNQHDPDDITAVGMSIAMLGEAGLASRIVHLDYNNHLGDNNAAMAAHMKTSAQGAAQRWGVSPSVLFDDQRNLSRAVTSIRNAINASSAGNRLYLLGAGPMEVLWRGINASNPAKRQFCTVISHSSFNDGHSDTPQMTHTWADIQASGVQTIHITDQNDGLATDVGPWTWLRDSSFEAWKWLYGRNQQGNLFDCSDAGMTYYVLTGRGDQSGNVTKVRDLFENGPGNPVGGPTSPPPPPPPPTSPPSPPPSGGQSIVSFTLVNADTDQDLGELVNGATVNLATLPTRNLNVRANTSPATVGSVRFGYDGNTNLSVENVAPYALAGDTSGDYNAWTPSIGSHSLSATPYALPNAGGAAGASKTVTFTVAN